MIQAKGIYFTSDMPMWEGTFRIFPVPGDVYDIPENGISHWTLDPSGQPVAVSEINGRWYAPTFSSDYWVRDVWDAHTREQREGADGRREKIRAFLLQKIEAGE